MRRYNLGFLKFGPLEECKDGELIYYQDHAKIVQDKEKLINAYSNDYHRICEIYENMNMKKDVYKSALFLSIIVNFTLISVSLSLYFN